MAPSFFRFRRRVARADLPSQAAAVCYRVSRSSLEFLLVNTSSGKWTFPKGRLNPSMSASQSAAQEAWEEAGARGLIAEKHFAFYCDTKRALGHDANSAEIRIAAYLFKVQSTVLPEESGRNPRWFSARDAKRQLAEGRSSQYARQITGIVDAAVEHLKRREKRGASIFLPAPRGGLATSR
jgi:8-oxo-dGTP pyrophosphatase MutT (NUDIX family)